MRHRLLIACLGVVAAYAAVSLPTYSSPAAQTVSARFDVSPPEAEVWIGGQRVGLAQTPFPLALGQFGGASDFLVQFVLDGYETTRVHVPIDYFRTHNVYPERGEVIMQADGFWGRVRHWSRTLGYRAAPMVAGVIAALFLGGLSLYLYRSSSRTSIDGLPPQLGDYRLLERIGAGTCATVYRGVSVSDRRPVAIKVIRDELSQQAEYRVRFEREIEVYRRLSHPGIIRLLDWGSHRDRLYVVTEFADGGTLADALAARNLARDDGLRLLREVFEAVDYAHASGVVHRDLKPQNVLLDAQGRARVADFGLAASASFATLTATGHMLGTPAYIAPELVRPTEGAAGADPRVDQYSLGILAYEILTGQRPFRMDTVEQALWSHLHGAPASASTLSENLSASVDPVLARMLAKHPSERYPSVGDAQRALDAAFAAEEAMG